MLVKLNCHKVFFAPVGKVVLAVKPARWVEFLKQYNVHWREKPFLAKLLHLF